jgi:hypothetical protein
MELSVSLINPTGHAEQLTASGEYGSEKVGGGGGGGKAF